MFIAAGGFGLKQSGLVAFWFGEASFGMELGEVGAWSGCGWFGDGRIDLVRWYVVRWSMEVEFWFGMEGKWSWFGDEFGGVFGRMRFGALNAE